MRFFVAALAISTIPPTVVAHHAETGLDRSAVRELEGVVTRVAWVNPHIRIFIDVDGEEWILNGQAAIGLMRLGVRPDIIQAGQTIKAAGFVREDDRYMGFFDNVLLADGTELLATRNARPRWSERTIGFGSRDPSGSDLSESGSRPEGIFRVWPRTIDVQVIRWPDNLPLTPYAAAFRSDWNPERDTTRRCVAPGMPRAMAQNPFAIQFVDRGDHIELRLEEFDQVRIIHLPGADIDESPTPSPLGYSTGEWEGESTLIVRTVAISYPFFAREGIPQGDSAEIIERFILSDDQLRLNYEITVTDPDVFTEPVTGTKYWDWKPGVELLPFEAECD